MKATQHHSYENLDDSDDEQEPESISDVDSLPNVDDGPCLINNMEKFMQSIFEVDYERIFFSSHLLVIVCHRLPRWHGGRGVNQNSDKW